MNNVPRSSRNRAGIAWRQTYRASDVYVMNLDGSDLRQLTRNQTINLSPSWGPDARSLVFAYVAAYLYEGDAPLAERKAQALALDRQLLRELLGQEELRELLDAAVIDAVEAEQQGLADERRVRHADAHSRFWLSKTPGWEHFQPRVMIRHVGRYGVGVAAA